MKYTILHSTNGTVEHNNGGVAKFETSKEANDFIRLIIVCADTFGFYWETGSYFEIVKKIGDDNYKKIGKKVSVYKTK